MSDKYEECGTTINVQNGVCGDFRCREAKGSDASTCSAAIAKARREKLWECLGTIQAWASKRAACEYNTETTLTMLARKVQETIDSVDKAGWRAAKKFEQKDK